MSKKWGHPEKQREAVEALEGARRAGVPLSEYAKSKGFELRPVYDAIATLRRRGALPPTDRPRKRRAKSKSRFVAVRVRSSPAAAAAAGSGLVCRLVRGDGCMIECGEWPPAAWLSRCSGDAGCCDLTARIERVYLHRAPVDMRRQIDGLSILARKSSAGSDVGGDVCLHQRATQQAQDSGVGAQRLHHLVQAPRASIAFTGRGMSRERC